MDIAELEGDEETGGDALWETKVPSPLKATYSAGRGSVAGGGKPATVGHRIGFGSTEEEMLVKVFGCKERGRQTDGPFDHATGKGWVQKQVGQYDDAINKRNQVNMLLVESTGGVAPMSRARVRRLSRRAKGKGAQTAW